MAYYLFCEALFSVSQSLGTEPQETNMYSPKLGKSRHFHPKCYSYLMKQPQPQRPTEERFDLGYVLMSLRNMGSQQGIICSYSTE